MSSLEECEVTIQIIMSKLFYSKFSKKRFKMAFTKRESKLLLMLIIYNFLLIQFNLSFVQNCEIKYPTKTFDELL